MLRELFAAVACASSNAGRGSCGPSVIAVEARWQLAVWGGFRVVLGISRALMVCTRKPSLGCRLVENTTTGFNALLACVPV
jgi:hypothetical protein